MLIYAQMSKLWMFLLCLVLALPAAAGEVDRQYGEYRLEDGVPVKIEAASGKLRLDSDAGEMVKVEMVLRCTGNLGPCEEAAADVALVSSRGDGEPIVWMGGPERFRRGKTGESPAGWQVDREPPVIRTCSASRVRSSSFTLRRWAYPLLRAPGWRLDVELGVRYPISRRVEVTLGEGEVTVSGLRSDAVVRVKSGTARLSMLEQDVGRLSLRARDGKVRVVRRDGRPLAGKGIKSSTVEWRGEGAHDVEVQVDDGDVLVSLL